MHSKTDSGPAEIFNHPTLFFFTGVFRLILLAALLQLPCKTRKTEDMP